jgi:hypothetical protein
VSKPAARKALEALESARDGGALPAAAAKGPAGAPHAVGAFNFKQFAANALKVAQFVLPLLLKA